MKDLGEHRCNECDGKGKCSIETAARYFGGHTDEIEELQAKVDALGKDFPTVMLASEADNPYNLINQAIATGWALAKGAALAPPKLDKTTLMNGALRAMLREEEFKPAQHPES